MTRGTESRGPRDTRPPRGPSGSPTIRDVLREVRIKDGVLACRRCFHVSGPYLDRAETVAAANRHWIAEHEPARLDRLVEELASAIRTWELTHSTKGALR